jgi:hypothetical protein
MSVALHVGPRSFSLGSSGFLNCFFSTVSVRLEAGRRGSRFPRLLEDLYSGRLPHESSSAALHELATIARELGVLSPGEVVWDDGDLALQPPWGTKLADSITSLGNYFWTNEGKPLLEVLDSALREAQARQLPLELR